MNIGLSSYAYLAGGGLVLKLLPDSDLRAGERRISRVKTLDGGVVITDSGFAHGDRTLRANVYSSKTLWEKLWALFQAASLVVISDDDGCFTGGLQNIKDQGDKIALEILLKEKISA